MARGVRVRSAARARSGKLAQHRSNQPAARYGQAGSSDGSAVGLLTAGMVVK